MLLPRVLFSIAHNMHLAYLESNRIVGRQSGVVAAAWIPPEAGSLKLNTDVGFDSSRSSGSCGLVIRDHVGSVVLVAAKRFEGVEDVLQAELLAVLLVCNWLVKGDYRLAWSRVIPS
ncbi:hypothetical protein PTKIN_Ptkin13bG0127200 [Pterospermum kingtungense]